MLANYEWLLAEQTYSRQEQGRHNFRGFSMESLPGY